MQLDYKHALWTQLDNAEDQSYRNNIHFKGILEATGKADPAYTTCSIFNILLFRSFTSGYKILDSTPP